jgi:hypothetical protein
MLSLSPVPPSVWRSYFAPQLATQQHHPQTRNPRLCFPTVFPVVNLWFCRKNVDLELPAPKRGPGI